MVYIMTLHHYKMKISRGFYEKDNWSSRKDEKIIINIYRISNILMIFEGFSKNLNLPFSFIIDTISKFPILE